MTRLFLSLYSGVKVSVTSRELAFIDNRALTHTLNLIRYLKVKQKMALSWAFSVSTFIIQNGD